MQNARTFRTISAEDIYAGIKREEARAANYRRATQPALRAKRVDAPVIELVPVVEAAEEVEVEQAVEHVAAKPAPKTTPAQSCDTIPAHSMRRMKAAQRVAGVPENIEEQISASVLRDPRRE